jgi:hypothetical protein
MPKPISELTDRELQLAAAGFPLPSELTDEQLLGLAAQQGFISEEDATNTLRQRKQAERAPTLDAIATAAGLISPGAPSTVRAILGGSGGQVGDVAAGVLSSIGGSMLGFAAGAPSGPGAVPMTAAGGAAGAGLGEGLVQARQYFRGERDEVGLGRLAGAVGAGAFPVGPQRARMAANIVRRGVQGAGISTAAELVGQLVDEGDVSLGRLASAGALGAIFGAGAGTAESLALRRAVLQQIRRTPEFKDFKGSDSELVDTLRAQMQPEPKNVTPAAEPPLLNPRSDSQPAAPADQVPMPPAPTGNAMQQFESTAGLAPRAPVPVPPPTPEIRPVTQLTDAELIAAAQAANIGQPAASALPTAAAPETSPETESGTTTMLAPEQYPVAEIPVDRIQVNKDVPQFKGAGDTKTGVVDSLQGSYQRLGTAPIVVWEKANGEQEVITGRHRLDLARRTGEKTIPAQVVRESDGFTRGMALSFDAESNIRDAQGEVKDYAHYFKLRPDYTQEMARARGLLRGAKGNSGWHLGKDASDDLYTLYANDQIPEAKAVAIARGAPQNVPAQASGIRAAKGMSPAELELYTRNLSQLTSKESSGSQLGFEGVDSSFADFEREAAAISKVQAERIASNRELVLAAQGAARRPEAARKMGLPVDDPTALTGRIQQLQGEIARYQNPDAATFNELRRAAGLPVAEETPAALAPAVEPIDPNQTSIFEPSTDLRQATEELRGLRAAQQAGQLNAAGHERLDHLERSIGQDFLDFYKAEKYGQPTDLVDVAALQRAELARKAETRMQAPDVQTQVDLFGPQTDKSGQFALFESSVNRYLDDKQIANTPQRAVVRSLLQAVWERRLARQLELDLGTDAALARALDLAPARRAAARNAAGQLGGDLLGGQPGSASALGLGGSIGQLPDAKVGPQPGGIELTARLYTQAFLADGFLQHVGRTFESDAQLISAAQVLRNRNVETLWVLPYDAAGRLLAPLAFSSRLPNMVDFGPHFEQNVVEAINRIKPARFEILHNHPSGDPFPSMADLSFTRSVAQKFPAFTRHFVINHGTYTEIPREGPAALDLMVPEIARTPDPTEKTQGNVTPYLGRPIYNADMAVQLGYQIQMAEQNITVFYLDVKNRIVATASVHASDLASSQFPEHFKKMGAAVGSVSSIAYYDGNQATLALARSALANGLFSHLIGINEGGAVLQEYSYDRKSNFGGTTNRTAIRVAEDDPMADSEATPPAPVAFVSQFNRTPVPQPLAQMHLVHPVEMPELVQLVKRLAGSIPQLKNLAKSRGYMKSVGSGEIVLDRRIFTDPVMANQVLAHELGHLVDYLPDRTLERGNLLGRLATLRDHLAQSLPIDPAKAMAPLTSKERAQLRRQAEKEVGKRPPQDEEADLAAWKAEVRKAYSELLQDALVSRGLAVGRGRDVPGGANVVGVGDVGTELKNLSFWWRPLGDITDEHYMAYRNSGKEIYADTLSVLFNAPAEFRDRAPTAWQMFFNYLDRKPEAQKQLLATWEMIHQGAATVSMERLRHIRTGFARADEILLAKAAERDSRKNSLPAILEGFKQKHFNIYAPIIDKARAAKASGAKLKWWEDPEFVFDAHPLTENVNYRFLDRVHKTVVEPLTAVGLDDATLGEYLFFNRVAHEAYMVKDQLAGRGVIANPLGHTAPTARRELLLMRYRLGPARFEAMQESARRFQDLTLEVIESGHQAGIYSDQQLALARANRYQYATFAVVDYLEQSTHIPAGFKQQRGTLSEIANPFLATVLKMMTANKLAELNRAKRSAVKLLADHFADEIALAPVSRIALANGRMMFRAKPAPAGKRELVVLENGRPTSWHVDPEMADMFERTPPASAHALVGVANWVFRNVFYPAFITYNPAFQIYANPIRDLSRSYVKLPPGVKRRKFIGEQVRALHGAKARLANDIRGPQLARRRELRALARRRPLTKTEKQELKLLDDRALAIEVLAQRGVTTPFESFASTPIAGDVWGKMLADYRLAPGSHDHSAALRQWAGLVPGLGKTLDYIERAGQISEAMPKLGAYRVLTRELNWPAEQAAYFIRNHVGTPNFTKRGRWTVWDGTIFPFINIFMRGLESDFQQMRGKIPGIPVDPAKQKSSYWFRMAQRTLGPRLLQGLAAAGLLGVGIKKIYDAFGEYDKTNYLILPFGTVHDGSSEYGYKAAGIRIPEDETARLLGGVVHQLTQLASQDDAAASMSLSDLINFSGGMVPGLNPVLTLANTWTQYASGLNPRDRLRGNPILTNNQFQVGGWESLKGMFAYTWDQVGGGNFVRYDPNAQTWQEHTFGSLPILSRAVKITDTGLRERQRNAEAALDARNARIRVAMPDTVNRLLAEYYRINAIRSENRTPDQAQRLFKLAAWYQDIWMPQYRAMQELPPDFWPTIGRGIADMSPADLAK